MSAPNLLGGRLLTGVLPPDKQPATHSLLPAYDRDLFDIEACIDDPTLAPLGNHVLAHKHRNKKEHSGQVKIQRNNNEIRKEGLLMLRRRGLSADDLGHHLERLMPLAPFLQAGSTFQDLVELDISRNKLQSLPPSLATLKQLVMLNASSNLLTTIPPQLYTLDRLQVLVLNQNLLTEIPDEMPLRLPNLVTLRMAHNAIGRMTPNVGHWRVMRQLQLGSVFGGNLLTHLPEEINDMTRLVELDLSHNNLRTLPPLELPHLLQLIVPYNQLEALPGSIAGCRRLKTLNVSNNHLQTLPANLAELCHLELFDLSSNLLCIMPAEILERMQTTLLITGNPLTRPGHCDLTTVDPYARILKRMTQHAVANRMTPSSPIDRCGPQGMGCLSNPQTTYFANTPISPLSTGIPAAPVTPSSLSSSSSSSSSSSASSGASPLSHSPAPLIATPEPQPYTGPRYRRLSDEDGDAVIDRELSYHARQLNIRGSRPNTPTTLAGTLAEDLEVDLDLLQSAPMDKQTGQETLQALNFVHSLYEIAARTALHKRLPWRVDTLPVSIAQDLDRQIRYCTACRHPYVKEWVTSVEVKSYQGHPAVVRRVRFCSTRCWKQGAQSEDARGSKVFVKRLV